MSIKFCSFASLLFTLCFGQVHYNHRLENGVEIVWNGVVYTRKLIQDFQRQTGADIVWNGVVYTRKVTPDLQPQNGVETVWNGVVHTQRTTSSKVTPVLQHSFDNHGFPGAWLVALPIGLFLLSLCFIICCKYRSRRRSQWASPSTPLTLHPPPPQPAPGIIIEQHAPPPGLRTDLPPPYSTQQLVPPPYDTQPVWGPSAPQQQFDSNVPPPLHQQFPTSYTNLNYAQHPEEKY